MCLLLELHFLFTAQSICMENFKNREKLQKLGSWTIFNYRQPYGTKEAGMSHSENTLFKDMHVIELGCLQRLEKLSN